MMTEQLINAAAIFLVLFSMVAAIDGLYFHLWKYRLYARPESLYEHKLHMARAFLFVPIVYFLFYRNFGGPALWLGVFFIAVDLVIEMLDVLDENKSRAKIGGLSSTEYAIHVFATTLRTACIALALADKPLSAWSLSSPIILEQQFPMANFIAFNIIPGNIVTAFLHVWLMRDKYRSKARFLPVRNCCSFGN
jgi:hypothetical protein